MMEEKKIEKEMEIFKLMEMSINPQHIVTLPEQTTKKFKYDKIQYRQQNKNNNSKLKH